jgi:large subunit ribosomal protein L17
VRHRKAGRRLGMAEDRRRALLRGLAASMILHEGITTTESRAKELRRFVERLVTISKRGDVAARRLAMQRLPHRLMVEKLFDVYGPRFQSRPGGYTRIIKLPARHGDAARMARIEFLPDIDEPTV